MIIENSESAKQEGAVTMQRIKFSDTPIAQWREEAKQEGIAVERDGKAWVAVVNREGVGEQVYPLPPFVRSERAALRYAIIITVP